MTDLTKLHELYLAKYPVEKVAEVIGKSPHIVERWKAGNVPALADVQKLVVFDPSVLPWTSAPAPEVAWDEAATAATTYAVSVAPELASAPVVNPGPTPYEWPRGQKIAILMPTNRGFHPGILKAFAAIFDSHKMQFPHPGTMMSGVITRNRNQLASEFLASDCEWALNWDDDTIPPFGDVQYHRAICENHNFPETYIKLHPIGRLLQAKKTLVGAVYFSRRKGGRAQFESAFINRAADEVEHRGPRNAVTKDGWCGLGFALVHRSVFTDIQKTQPELEIKNPALIRQLGYNWRFFNALSVTGEDSEHSEDAAFCARAAKAGHVCYVDHAISCAHIGDHGYSFANTGNRAIPLI